MRVGNWVGTDVGIWVGLWTVVGGSGEFGIIPLVRVPVGGVGVFVLAGGVEANISIDRFSTEASTVGSKSSVDTGVGIGPGVAGG